MAGLSTHILDTSAGKPAADVLIELYTGDSNIPAVSTRTNVDGRTDQPLVTPGNLEAGVYELRFHAGDYFRTQGIARSEMPFLDVVIVRFGIDKIDEHYHVPLLLSPFGYSTYRGS